MLILSNPMLFVQPVIFNPSVSFSFSCHDCDVNFVNIKQLFEDVYLVPVLTPEYIAPNIPNANVRSQSSSETGTCANTACANKSADAVFSVGIHN